ncbi:hypothetical protein ACS0TY_004079 [Phlomoides rotata]
MQSGGGQQGGGGGHGRSTAASASCSPSSSSSAVSAFDQQQQQRHHQQQQRQSLQQQFLRRPEGNDALLAYQAGSIQGVLGGPNFTAASGSMQLPQQPRKFMDLGQHGTPNAPEQSHNRSQGVEQQMLNPIQQAYLQCAYQAAQQKSNMGFHLSSR